MSGGISVSRLLRQRLNRVLFYIARGKGVSIFYNYGCPVIIGSCPADEFSNGKERTVDWSVYDSGVYAKDGFD